MIKDTNERITITLSKKQVKWLKKLAKSKNISISKLISYILMSDIEKLYTILERNNDEINELIRIAKYEIDYD